MVFVATLSQASHSFAAGVGTVPGLVHAPNHKPVVRRARPKQKAMVDQPWWKDAPPPASQSSDAFETAQFETTSNTTSSTGICRSVTSEPLGRARPPPRGTNTRRYNSAVDVRRVEETSPPFLVTLPDRPRLPANLPTHRNFGDRPLGGVPGGGVRLPPPSVTQAMKNPNTLAAKHRTVSEPMLDRYFHNPPPTSAAPASKGRKPAPLSADRYRRTHGMLAPAAEPIAGNPAPLPVSPISPTNETVGSYIILKTLGSGAFSHVKLAVHSRDGVRVAIKMLEKPGGPATITSTEHAVAADQAANEAAIIADINHPHIIRLLTTFETETHNCLVLEYVPNSDLYELITLHPASLTPPFVRRVFRELCSAVAYLHARQICHRDLKIENILVDSEGGVKVTDFGLAVRFDPNVPLEERCGSEEYAAPELIQALPYDGRQIDIWALGIILFTLLTGELPFSVRPGERPRRMFHRIARGDFRFPAHAPGRRHISDQARDLVRKLLTTNPAKRITMDAIRSHPYLTGRDIVLEPREPPASTTINA
ncbi:Serine/threonine-protein kinase par-1 [Thoreauomyces humboldtii]|nr:Serine/threonine-protein kinase par-1 [Thoreauomyces humboldtii]